jgi:hypothetical protein
MPNIPTPEHAELFAQSVKKWQQVLSLGDWRIEKGSKPAKSAMASVSSLLLQDLLFIVWVILVLRKLPQNL